LKLQGRFDYLSKVEKQALHALQGNVDLTGLLADKGNVLVVLIIVDYMEKVTAPLDDPVYKELAKDPTQSMELRNTLFKGSSLPKDVAEQPQPHGLRPPIFYRLPKIHMAGVPLMQIISTIGTPTYRLAEFLASLLVPHLGNSTHHVGNSDYFIHTLGTLHVQPIDILVSPDVSLFMWAPTGDSFNLPILSLMKAISDCSTMFSLLVLLFQQLVL
jgi:hypothetical protein